MSAEYPVLDNRPINKWKVTELREELRRRNLTPKGLKDDLVKRLFEAIRIEMDTNEEEDCEGPDRSDEGTFGDVNADTSGVYLAEGGVDHNNKELNQRDDVLTKCDRAKALERDQVFVTSAMTIVSEQSVTVTSSTASDLADKVSQITSTETVRFNEIAGKGDDVFDTPKKDVFEAFAASSSEFLDNKFPSSMKTDEGKTDNKETFNKSLESSEVAADHNKAHLSNQVYDEVSPNLGFNVESESFSSDTLTNNKKELKDNLNADNVQLESECVLQEMVQPSFGRDPRGGGTIFLSDDLTSHGNQTLNGVTDDKPKNLEFSEKNDNQDKLSVDIHVVGHSLEDEATEKVANDNVLNQMDSAKDASPVYLVAPQKTEPHTDEKSNIAVSGEESNPQDLHDFNKTIDVMMDGELLEKVNLDDQSSADEMEEDTLDTKLVESDHNSSKIDESNKEPGADLGEDLHHLTSTNKLEVSHDHKESVTEAVEKRKFQDATKSGSTEPLKRQRRWNTEGQKASDPLNSDASVPTKSNLTLQTASARANLSRSNSSPRVETPKERVVPPSERTPTTSLRIDNFVRPFTLKAVHELLEKTGKVCSFWMDHIKTHCYVSFASPEEAIETRNAVYNLQWPINGGRLLLADFVDPEEVKMHVEGSSQPATLSANTKTPVFSVQPPMQPAVPTVQQVPKQHQEPLHPLSRVPPARAAPSSVKDQLLRATSPIDDKLEAPMLTLDDLFRRTKASPRIYYLPLTDEEVAAKASS